MTTTRVEHALAEQSHHADRPVRVVERPAIEPRRQLLPTPGLATVGGNLGQAAAAITRPGSRPAPRPRGGSIGEEPAMQEPEREPHDGSPGMTPVVDVALERDPSNPVRPRALDICQPRSLPLSVRDRQPTTAQSPIRPMITTEPPPEWIVGFEPMATRTIAESRFPSPPVTHVDHDELRRAVPRFDQRPQQVERQEIQARCG